MSKIMNYSSFVKEVVAKYFSLRDYKNIPKVVQTFFENRSKNYINLQYYVPMAVFNITELNLEQFFKKDKSSYSFDKSSIVVYIFEYTKTYHKRNQESKNDFAASELIYDLYIYNKQTDSIIAYLEARNDISNFTTIDRHFFIGMISVNKEFQRQRMASFMLRVMSFYTWIRKRVMLTSDTLMSEDMLETCRFLNKNTKWVIQDNYMNNQANKEQDRYLFLPLKLNKTVISNNNQYLF